MSDHAKQLAEIKARAEAAEAPYVDDVPFLLEQLKTWRMTSAVFEKAAESAQAKLAASEAAAGAMRQCMDDLLADGKIDTADHHRDDCPGQEGQGDCDECLTADKINDAFGERSGRGWLSPEEAERTKNEMATLRECKSIVEHQRNEHREEVERLRKELERRETHHKELHNANEQLSASLTSADNRYYLLLDATEKGGLVSEEECARRCREVAEIVLLKCHVCGKPARVTFESAELTDGEFNTP